jgi:hypothetical protein
MISRSGSRVARTAALLALGGLAVHQLRYLVAFGSHSGAELHQEGHDYLAQALPILVGLAVAAIVARLLTGALKPTATAPRKPWLVRGLTYAAAIASIFWAQELAEGALAAGHPAGVAAVLGGGAWIALPLALGLGLAAAAVERLLDQAERAITTALGIVTTPLARPSRPTTPISLARAPLASRALASGFAGRAPPPVALA